MSARTDSIGLQSGGWWGPRLCALAAVIWLASFAGGYEASVSALTLVGVLGALLGLFLPSLGLLSVVLLCALDPLSRVYLMTGGFLRWNSLNYLLLVVVLLCLPVVGKIRDTHSKILQAFVLFLLIGLAYSTDLMNGVMSLMNVASVFGLLVYFMRAAADRGAFVWVGLFGGSVTAVGGALLFLQIDRLPYINPNAWSLFPLTGIFAICLATPFACLQPAKRAALAILAAANLVLVFLSTSRGAMLIGVVCLVYLLFYLNASVGRALSWGLATVALTWFLGSVSEMGQLSTHRLLKMFDDEYSLAERTSGRTHLAFAGLEIFTENPFGLGTGGFKEEFARQWGGGEETGLRRNAHSAWIMTLAENGLIGFSLLFLYVISFAVEAWRRKPAGFAGLGLLVTLVLATAFLSREFQGKGVWLLAAGGSLLLSSGLGRSCGSFGAGRPVSSPCGAGPGS